MTVKGPRVRDFSASNRRLDVEVVSGEATETLLAMFVYGAGCLSPADYEVDEDWFSEVEGAVPKAARDAVSLLGECGEVWLSLVGIAVELAEPRTTAALAERIRSLDPVELRASLLHVITENGKERASEADVPAAAAGDLAAFDRVTEATGRAAPGLRALVEMPAEEARELVADAVAGFAAAVDPAWVDAMARDAADVRMLARTLDTPALVERVTNGITFTMQPDLSGVVLVPSAVVRPWVTITEMDGGRKVFCYSIADERLDADPAAPPGHLVEIYKALGDERRLRILGELAGEPLGLADLTERLEVAKSTVHHHLRVLRTAGLVRVTLGEEKMYSLRTDGLPEAARILDGYLSRRASAGAEQGAAR